MRIRGVVTGFRGMPLVATVTLTAKGFRSATIIAQTETDSKGYYEVKVAAKQIGYTSVENERTYGIQATAHGGFSAAATFILSQPEIECNLIIENSDALTSSEFTLAVDAIQSIIDTAAIESVTLEGEDSEAAYLTNATGFAHGMIQQVVTAHSYAEGTAIDPKFFYALLKANRNFSRAALVNYSKAELVESINRAVSEFFIDSATETEVSDAADALIALSVSLTKETVLPIEEFKSVQPLALYLAIQHSSITTLPTLPTLAAPIDNSFGTSLRLTMV